MRFTTRALSLRDHTLLRRVLTCVLLVGIGYSAAFVALHSHGAAGGSVAETLLERSAGTPFIAADAGSDASECLICVLHRQFSSSTFESPGFVVGARADIALVSTPGVFYYRGLSTSRPLARLAGRAPPRIQA